MRFKAIHCQVFTREMEQVVRAVAALDRSRERADGSA